MIIYIYISDFKNYLKQIITPESNKINIDYNYDYDYDFDEPWNINMKFQYQPVEIIDYNFKDQDFVFFI